MIDEDLLKTVDEYEIQPVHELPSNTQIKTEDYVSKGILQKHSSKDGNDQF